MDTFETYQRAAAQAMLPLLNAGGLLSLASNTTGSFQVEGPRRPFSPLSLSLHMTAVHEWTPTAGLRRARQRRATLQLQRRLHHRLDRATCPAPPLLATRPVPAACQPPVVVSMDLSAASSLNREISVVLVISSHPFGFSVKFNLFEFMDYINPNFFPFHVSVGRLHVHAFLLLQDCLDEVLLSIKVANNSESEIDRITAPGFVEAPRVYFFDVGNKYSYIKLFKWMFQMLLVNTWKYFLCY
jgi:hypothetical protein